jgi:hypothetical protein
MAGASLTIEGGSLGAAPIRRATPIARHRKLGGDWRHCKTTLRARNR